MNPQQLEQLQQELLELHFGCHPDPGALQERLAHEPAVQEVWQQLQQTADLLQEAARDTQPELDLSPFKSYGRTPWKIHAFAAASLFTLVSLGGILHWQYRKYQFDRIQEQYVAFEVRGPESVTDGAPSNFQIAAFDLQENETRIDFDWQAKDANSRVFAQGQVKQTSLAHIELPPHLPGVRSLEIVASISDAREQAIVNLAPDSIAPLVYLSSDRPLYRPGESAWLRVVTLDRLTLMPLNDSMRVRIIDPKGAEVYRKRGRFQDGVLALKWDIAENSAGGEYFFEVRDSADEFTLERLSLQVRRYQAPQLQKEIDLDQESYLPGEQGAAEIRIRSLSGQSLIELQVTGSIILDGSEIWQETRSLGPEAKDIFQFTLPAEVQAGQGLFVLRVRAGGIVETQVEPFRVPTGRLHAAFYPEGGDLIAGLPNRIYVEVQDSTHQAADVSGQLTTATGKWIADFTTQHQGRGWLDFEPQIGERYELHLPGNSRGLPLPEIRDEGVVLRAREVSTDADSPLRLQLLSKKEGSWQVAVFLRGVRVATQEAHGSGVTNLNFDLPNRIAGVLRVTVFDSENKPIAERLVHKQTNSQIDVRIQTQSQSLQPGEKQRLTFTTTTEQGRPVSALLGVSVTDQTSYAKLDVQRVGLADHTWLVGDVRALEDVEDFLSDGPNRERNIDLLLGTRGWRRFAWATPQEFLASQEEGEQEAVLPMLAREGYDASAQRLARERSVPPSKWRQSRRQVEKSADLGKGLALLAGIACALTLGFASILRLGLLGSHPILCFGTSLLLGSATAFGGLWVFTQQWRNQMGAALPASLMELGYGGGTESSAAPTAEGNETFARSFEQLGYRGEDTFEGNSRDLSNLARNIVQARDSESLPTEAEPTPALTAQVNPLENASSRSDDGNRMAYRAVSQRFGGFLYVREYAHRHQADDYRNDFTETVYWNAHLQTDTTGRAQVEFDLSDRISEWVISVDAHGATRVGQTTARFQTRLPFQMEAQIPAETTAGDSLWIPIALSAAGDANGFADIKVMTSEGLSLMDSDSQQVELRNGSARLLLPIEVGMEVEEATLRIQGQFGGWRDAVEQRIRIVARGFPHRIAYSGYLEEITSFAIDLPQDLRQNSLQAQIKLYPSPLAGLQDGMEGILQEPHGCFEQTSSRHYPNVLTLAYLEASGTVAPALKKRALEMIDRGYQRLVSFECPSSGYEWFGADPGHGSLTAYGLMEFSDMVDVYSVETSMLERTQNWLLQLRDGQGNFRGQSAKFSFGAAPQEIRNAYIVYSLLSADVETQNLQSELDALLQRAQISEDPYELAVIACALNLAAFQESAQACRNRLKLYQKMDGSLQGTTTSFTSSRGVNLAVETTSFAVLAWLPEREDHPYAERAIRYLAGQRQGNGTFGATQATVMALKALTRFQQFGGSREVRAGAVEAYVNGQLMQRLEFPAREIRELQLQGLHDSLQIGTNQIELRLSGENRFPWALDLRYYADLPSSHPNAPVAVQTQLASAQVEEGQTVNLNITVRNQTAEELPMILAVIGLPAGLEVSSEVLKSAQQSGAFDFVEIYGRDLALYWRGMPAEAHKQVNLDLIARIPGLTTGPASRAYLYYATDQIHWAEPLRIEVVPTP